MHNGEFILLDVAATTDRRKEASQNLQLSLTLKKKYSASRKFVRAFFLTRSSSSTGQAKLSALFSFPESRAKFT
jgi:hypothetical protein